MIFSWLLRAALARPMNNPTSDTEQTRAPGALNATIQRARLEMSQRNWSAALIAWNEARTLGPDRPGVYTGTASVLKECGRLTEAEELLLGAIERFPDSEQIAISLASLANVRRDWPSALRRWESVRQKFPHNPSTYVGSLAALSGAGRTEEADALLPAAQAVLDATRASGAETLSSLWLELTLAKVRCDWPSVRRLVDSIIAREPVASQRALLARAQACWHMGEIESAAQAAEQVLAIDPTVTEALIIGAWAATEQGNGAQALELYKRLADINPDTSRWLLKRVQLLNWLGQVEEAVAELKPLLARWPNDPKVRAFLRKFGPGSAMARESNFSDSGDADVFKALEAAAPGPAIWKRSLVNASSELEVQVAAVSGATTALLVFTGAADGVSMPLSIFDRYLAGLDVTVIYLKDFRRLVYLSGIRSLGHDFDATIVAMRDLLSKQGIKRVVTLGNCDGGMAAIRYGIELDAERIIAAGASTHFANTVPRLEQARNFKRVRIAEKVPTEMADLRPLLLSREYRAQILVLYLEEDERQRHHALHISGAPNVALQAVAGKQPHSVLHRLALSSPQFQDTIAGWLALAQPGSSI